MRMVLCAIALVSMPALAGGPIVSGGGVDPRFVGTVKCEGQLGSELAKFQMTYYTGGKIWGFAMLDLASEQGAKTFDCRVADELFNWSCLETTRNSETDLKLAVRRQGAQISVDTFNENDGTRGTLSNCTEKVPEEAPF